MSSYLLAIDQGTTGSTCLLVNKADLKIISKSKVDFQQIFPKPSWVEHNLEDIWNSVREAILNILSETKIDPKDIVGIGITNQRETTCAYTKAGKPISNAIVWQDRRTSQYCQENASKYEPLKSITGLPLDSYFSATKMHWLLNNHEGVKSHLEKNDLRLSTVDSFLLYRLTNSQSFKTDPSNASRTLLMSLKTFQWDKKLLDFFNLTSDLLPEITSSFNHFGETKNCDFLPDGIPILCILGDQQAALFGQAGTNKGDLKCTYGTGAFLLQNTGEDIVFSDHGLLTSAFFQFKQKKYYVLEGSTYIAGAAVGWLRDQLKIIRSSTEIEKLANDVSDLASMKHILFLPFFTGIGTPYWNSDAKAAILGLTRDSKNTHIARACLEGIALSVNDSIQCFIKDTKNIPQIKIDGGASENNLLCQLQANFSKLEILRPAVTDTTGFGVILGCLVSNGETQIDELSKLWKLNQSFAPTNESYYEEKSALWTETIRKIY